MLGACDPDLAEPQPSTSGGDAGDTDTGDGGADDGGVGGGAGDGNGGAGGASDGGDGTGSGGGGEQPAPEPAGGFSLTLPNAPGALTEGGDAVVLDVGVARVAGDDRPVSLAVEDDLGGFAWTFGSTRLEAGRSETTLSVTLPIATLPRLPGRRTLRLVATDDAGARVEGELAFDVTPTARPDIYLLAGQSNMVGSTEEAGVRQAFPGGLDEPDRRIRQLNVTNNEFSRFPTPEAYTDVNLIADPERRIVEALDPLHDRNTDGDDPKSGDTIGLGLTFAKEALDHTEADIVLVPTAWSDTGFCRRASNRFDFRTGWNAVTPASSAFAGTLLHDRAIARTNLAIAETGGVLRGILWHQGEADSEDETCALAYAENLRLMVESLRSSIEPDARGPSARGRDARIPFIVGTMSKGRDPRGDYSTFSEIKSRVDAAHRDVASTIPLATFVNADDLVPPAFPCGQGECVHFGGAALRELGRRYHEALRGLFRTP